MPGNAGIHHVRHGVDGPGQQRKSDIVHKKNKKGEKIMKYVSDDGRQFSTEKECLDYEGTPEFREWKQSEMVKSIERYIESMLGLYDEKCEEFEKKCPEFLDTELFTSLLETEEGRKRRMEIFEMSDELDFFLYEFVLDTDEMVAEYIAAFPEEEEFKKKYYEEIRPELVDEETEEYLRNTFEQPEADSNQQAME